MSLLASIKADEDALIKQQEESGYEPEETSTDDNRSGDENDEHESEDEETDEGSEDGGGKQDDAEPSEKSEPAKTDEEKEDLLVPKDAAAWAKMRRENRLLRQQQQSKETVTEKAEPVNLDPEPNKIENYEAWLEWKQRQLDAKVDKIESWQQEQLKREETDKVRQGAVNEYMEYEKAFISKTPDYESITQNAYNRLYRGFLDLNPSATQNDAAEYIMKYTLSIASEAVREGLDPAEAVYMTAKMRFGVPQTTTKPVAIEQNTNTKSEKPRIDLKRIDSGRKKSASSLVGGSNSNSVSLSLESIADMPMGEFSKLSPQTLRELEAQVA